MELVAESLTCTRSGVPVLERVSFALDTGHAMVLRGPNGAGKTTLLRTVCGLQPAAAGRVRGVEQVAYAGHADAVKPTLTVTENLEFWAAIHGTTDIAGALAAFDLDRLRDRPALHLSAGQRRRLGLARLLVTERPIWALDEPTVSLDAASVERFAAVVHEHLSRGGSAIIATHLDLGIDAQVLDVTQFAARAPRDAFDAAFG